MTKYKQFQNGVIDTETGVVIPMDPANRHWNEYTKWVNDGNSPDPADTVDPWIEIRALRDILLQQSDWTQISDAPLDPAAVSAWGTYRQELRDIPQTFAGAPESVVWPTQP